MVCRISLSLQLLLTDSSGIGQTMWQVIAGRIVAGIGGAGMTVIVSVLITGKSRNMNC
jgi:MFS family permease